MAACLLHEFHAFSCIFHITHLQTDQNQLFFPGPRFSNENCSTTENQMTCVAHLSAEDM